MILLKKIFSLSTLVGLTVLAVAGSAGYFSVYGLMLIFSGAAIYVGIMGAALEIGKLVLTSVLFNYWRRLNFLLVTYGIVAVISLMAITSVGVYGFLSSAYQINQSPLEQINERINLLDGEYQRKMDRLANMDAIIASISADYITKRLEEKKQQQPERDQLNTRIAEIDAERLSLATTKLETEVHIGPIVKIAEAFNVTRDQAVHWLIIIIIVVFDPLAVALTLCLNTIIASKQRDDNGSKNKNETFSDAPPVIEQNHTILPTDPVENIVNNDRIDMLMKSVHDIEQSNIQERLERQVQYKQLQEILSLQMHDNKPQGDVNYSVDVDSVDQPIHTIPPTNDPNVPALMERLDKLSKSWYPTGTSIDTQPNNLRKELAETLTTHNRKVDK